MKTIYLLLIGAVLLGSCKKDDSSTPAPTRTDLLTGKDWLITGATVSPGITVGGITITDIYPFLDDCSKDNFVRFDKPNVYKEDEGAKICQGSAQTTTGTWVLSTDETKLTTTDASGSQTFTIVEISATAMKQTYTQTSGGVTSTYTISLTKK